MIVSPIPFTARILVPDTTLIQESSGEAVILSLANDSYYGLNSSGTRMWNALTTAESIQHAFDGLLGEFEVNETILHSDLEAFIADLIQNQLIQISDNA